MSLGAFFRRYAISICREYITHCLSFSGMQYFMFNLPGSACRRPDKVAACFGEKALCLAGELASFKC